MEYTKDNITIKVEDNKCQTTEKILYTICTMLSMITQEDDPFFNEMDKMAFLYFGNVYGMARNEGNIEATDLIIKMRDLVINDLDIHKPDLME